MTGDSGLLRFPLVLFNLQLLDPRFTTCEYAPEVVS
jgi:hypothetical protein